MSSSSVQKEIGNYGFLSDTFTTFGKLFHDVGPAQAKARDDGLAVDSGRELKTVERVDGCHWLAEVR